MNQQLLQIDVSKAKYETKEGDIVNINLNDEDIIQVQFSKLFILSKYIHDKYKYSEGLAMLQKELENITNESDIKSTSINFFFQLIQEEIVSIPIEHFHDIYQLCEYFDISSFTRELDEISEREIFNNLTFSIQKLKEMSKSDNKLESNFTSKIENFLSTRINECIVNEEFEKLPIASVYRIIEKSDKNKVNFEELVEFILKSASTRFVILKLVELDKVRKNQIERLINFLEMKEEGMKEMCDEFLPLSIPLIKRLMKKNDELAEENEKLKEENKKTKEENEKIKEENKRLKEEVGRIEIEFKQTKEKFEQNQREQKQAEDESKQMRSEHKQYARSILAGGYDGNNMLGENPNNKAAKDSPAIHPPLKMRLDPSSLLSYSAYNDHSVAVTRSGSLHGIGRNDDGRISSSLAKNDIKQFTDFSISDGNGRQLEPVSAVCSVYGTLYMLTKSSGRGRQLVLCDCEINDHQPVFLDIGDECPVSLFGGCSHTAAINEKGEVIFINRSAVKNSPSSPIASSSLPGGEKAASVACLEKSVFVLSSSGRVFESKVESSSSVLRFSPVSELLGKEIVCVSGTYYHCLAVSNEGRVFGHGSNNCGELGIGEGRSEVSSFTEISSLFSYKIRAAYAGYTHSLFETEEGKILSCGWNGYGELLLSRGPSNEKVYTPTETTITSGATFCIAGCHISAVFIGGNPPPNTPNNNNQNVTNCNR